MNTVMQLIVSGLTVGSIYALVALGFTLIYRASDIFNFAQGEFFMLGGMITGVMFSSHYGSYVTAALLAITITVLFGAALYILAIRQAKSADTIQLLILTLGASMLASGLASAFLGKDFVRLPAFFEQEMFILGGIAIQTQALVVMAGTALIVMGLWLFLNRTLTGKAIVAVASNTVGAELMGINRLRILTGCFALSALIGALGGILATPITLTSYDSGTMLTIKGFTGAMLGGMGTPYGPVIGGLIIGLLEAFGAGYLSSVYKDAFALIVLLAVFSFRPQGIFSSRSVERV